MLLLLITKNIIPVATKFIPKIITPLATGAITFVGDVAMKKIMGRGIINVPPDKKNDLIKSSKLTKSQINKLLNSPCQCQLKLTKKQSQNGGFLGLLASLGIPIISSLISNLIGKGLQMERSRGYDESLPRIRAYRQPSSGKVLQMDRSRGNGLQIDSASRNYRRIQITELKKAKIS